jgi:hypothetical protein
MNQEIEIKHLEASDLPLFILRTLNAIYCHILGMHHLYAGFELDDWIY